MSKKIIWVTACVFLVALIGGGILYAFEYSPKSGELIINGVAVTQENVVLHSSYADLPLTEVMKSFNMEVNWIDENVAEITYEDKKYSLNLSEISLIEVEPDCTNYNLITPAPGGRRHYTVLEKELILDSVTIKCALYKMGINIYIDVDRKEQIVSIVEGTD